MAKKRKRNEYFHLLLISFNLKNIMKSYLNISFNTLEEPVFEPTITFFKELSQKLEEASVLMPFSEFQQMFIQIVKKCIKKAQVDSTFNDALDYVKKWSEQYCSNLQIIARILILQAGKIGRQIPSEALKKMNKVKHILVDTEYEYLLTKVFVQESRIYEMMGEREQQFKILKKCIEYGENYAVQFLKQTKQIRIQIADNMIIAYFQMFKQTKENKPDSAINYLSKAYHAAQKNYGSQHFSTQNLFHLLQQQRNLMINIDKISPKALTQILCLKKKHSIILVQYSWQEELLVVQLFRKQEDENKLIKQHSINIRLDMGKIKSLQNQDYTEWLQVKGTEITVVEEELFRIVDKNVAELSRDSKNMSLKQVSRGEVFKRIEERGEKVEKESSSSDDEDIVLPQQDNFLRYYRKDKINHSRSKSRESRN